MMQFSGITFRQDEIDDDNEDYSRTLYMIEGTSDSCTVTEFESLGNEVTGFKQIPTEDFLAQFSTRNARSADIIDPRVLVNSPSHIVFQYTPEKNQPFFYKHGKNQCAMSINWNHLVFCYDKSTTSLCVAVTQHAKRCTATTRLYFAPLPNVWQNTSICLGSVNLPKTEDIDEIAKAYINSTKTHLNHTGMFRDSQVSNTEFFDLITTKAKKKERFKVSELTPIGTLSQWLNKVTNKDEIL